MNTGKPRMWERWNEVLLCTVELSYNVGAKETQINQNLNGCHIKHGQKVHCL